MHHFETTICNFTIIFLLLSLLFPFRGIILNAYQLNGERNKKFSLFSSFLFIITQNTREIFLSSYFFFVASVHYSRVIFSQLLDTSRNIYSENIILWLYRRSRKRER